MVGSLDAGPSSRHGVGPVTLGLGGAGRGQAAVTRRPGGQVRWGGLGPGGGGPGGCALRQGQRAALTAVLGISESCVGSGPDRGALEATTVTTHGTTDTRVHINGRTNPLCRASSIHAVQHAAALTASQGAG